MKNIEILNLDKKSDERGWLIEVLGGELPDGCKKFGQIHVSVAYPGKVRGNHYHTRKVEWFCVPTGKGLLILEDRETGETQEVMMGINNLKTIKIEPGTIHAIKNIGEDDMVLIVYSNESFDPEDPDTYYKKILA
ncbi:MAG: WxcM-like domain-containing protein [Nitrospinota bacterium]|nr:WxcM-like domain-containing protein [Nitrospinota bacterium]